jgi:hypothetical protein
MSQASKIRALGVLGLSALTERDPSPGEEDDP